MIVVSRSIHPGNLRRKCPDGRLGAESRRSERRRNRSVDLLSKAEGIEFLGFDVSTANERFGAPFTPNDPYFP